MDEKPDNLEPEESGNPSPQGEDFRLSPDLVNPDSQADTVPGKTLELNFAEDDDVGVHPGQIDLGPYVESDRKMPTFHSRFHSWMKAVSLAIILVFVPEQASWAFNYNPLVLWGDKSAYPSQSAAQPHGAEFNELVSEHIAGSVYKLLGDVAYKDNARVKLQLPAGGANSDQDVSLNVNIKGENPFNLEYINQVVSWLRQPEIHPLNCGVYALRDILTAYEIEAWMSGQNAYREIVSCSNCLEYQARRLKIRFREKTNEDTKYVHTLNSTLVATSRILVSILENFQTKDGHVRIPKVLEKYVGKNTI